MAFNTVVDLSEDEIVALLPPLASSPENAMDVDARDNSPTLATVIGWVVGYAPRASSAPLRLAMRQYIPGAEELTKILVILDEWIVYWGTSEQQLLVGGRTAKGTKDKSDIPALEKVVLYLFFSAFTDRRALDSLVRPNTSRQFISCPSPTSAGPSKTARSPRTPRARTYFGRPPAATPGPARTVRCGTEAQSREERQECRQGQREGR